MSAQRRGEKEFAASPAAAAGGAADSVCWSPGQDAEQSRAVRHACRIKHSTTSASSKRTPCRVQAWVRLSRRTGQSANPAYLHPSPPPTCAPPQPDVVTKYKAAAKIVNCASCRRSCVAVAMLLLLSLKSAHAHLVPRLVPAQLVAATLAAVIEACKPGAKIVDICQKGDDLVKE